MRECQRLSTTEFSGDWDYRAQMRKTWIAVCRQANAVAPDDLRIKHMFARALSANGEREEAIVHWRELADKGDAAAAFEIYDMYKSYFRSDVTEPQLVKRAEAERMLRKAAELGDAYSILMLAVLLDRGDTVKRNPEDAIKWAERALANPAKYQTAETSQALLGRLLVKSSDPAQRARGIGLLEKLAQAGSAQGKTELAIAIRATDPVRARALLEQGMRGYPGGAMQPLTDMLIKGDGGPADPKRAVKMLTASRASDPPAIRGALGRLYIEGKLVPQDLKKGTDLLRTWATWDYEARLELLALLAAHPELTVAYPSHIIYDLTEAAELGEPGAAEALINLKLSENMNFADKAGGCALAASESKRGNEVAARRLKDCAN